MVGGLEHHDVLEVGLAAKQHLLDLQRHGLAGPHLVAHLAEPALHHRVFAGVVSGGRCDEGEGSGSRGGQTPTAARATPLGMKKHFSSVSEKMVGGGGGGGGGGRVRRGRIHQVRTRSDELLALRHACGQIETMRE